MRQMCSPPAPWTDVGGNLGRWRGCPVGEEARIERGEQSLLLRRVRLLRTFDQEADVIARSKSSGNQLPARSGFALANPVECCLNMMSEGCGGFEAEHCAGALYGVQSAECGVDQARVIRRNDEVEQRRFKLDQKLLGFLLKNIERVCRAHSPRTFLATATSCSG